MINMNNNGLYNKMKKFKYQKLLRINIRFNKKYIMMTKINKL